MVHRLLQGLMEGKSGGMDANEVKEEMERAPVTLWPVRKRPEKMTMMS